MGLFTRPRVDITVDADNVEVQGVSSRSRIDPTFHVIRRAAPLAGQAPWVIVGGPGFEPTQPPQYVLNVLRRHEWPSDAAAMWGDYVALLFAVVFRRPTPRFWRRPDVHVHVRALMAPRDRDEFETRGREALVRCGARSVSFQWQMRLDRSRDVAVADYPVTQRYRAALECGAAGDLRRARDELDALLRDDPTHTSGKLRLRLLDDAAAGRTSEVAVTHLFRALLRSSSGDDPGALAEIDSAIAASPSYDEAFRLRARTLVDLGDMSRAIEAYDRALALNATNVMALINRGNAYSRQGRPIDALADFDRAIALDPANAEAIVNRGTAHIETDQAQKAIADFDRALALDPGLGVAYNNKALLLERTGQEAEALSVYQSLVTHSRPEFLQIIEHAQTRIAALSEKRPDEES